MTNQEIVSRLIKGQTISILCPIQFKEIRKELREIKKNCTIVLSQMNEQ